MLEHGVHGKIESGCQVRDDGERLAEPLGKLHGLVKEVDGRQSRYQDDPPRLVGMVPVVEDARIVREEGEPERPVTAAFLLLLQ